MSELQILYYFNSKTDILEPVVKEKGDIQKNNLQLFYSIIDSVKMEEDMIHNLRMLAFGSYYVDLLNKGHSFEEIYTLLTNAIRDKWEQPNFNNCLGELYEHRDALNLANQYYKNANEEMNNNFVDFMNQNYNDGYKASVKLR